MKRFSFVLILLMFIASVCHAEYFTDPLFNRTFNLPNSYEFVDYDKEKSVYRKRINGEMVSLVNLKIFVDNENSILSTMADLPEQDRQTHLEGFVKMINNRVVDMDVIKQEFVEYGNNTMMSVTCYSKNSNLSVNFIMGARMGKVVYVVYMRRGTTVDSDGLDFAHRVLNGT